MENKAYVPEIDEGIELAAVPVKNNDAASTDPAESTTSLIATQTNELEDNATKMKNSESINNQSNLELNCDEGTKNMEEIMIGDKACALDVNEDTGLPGVAKEEEDITSIDGVKSITLSVGTQTNKLKGNAMNMKKCTDINCRLNQALNQNQMMEEGIWDDNRIKLFVYIVVIFIIWIIIYTSLNTTGMIN